MMISEVEAWKRPRCGNCAIVGELLRRLRVEPTPEGSLDWISGHLEPRTQELLELKGELR